MENQDPKNDLKNTAKVSTPLAPELVALIGNYLKKAGLSEDLIAQIHQFANGSQTEASPQKVTMDSALSLAEREKAKKAIRPLAGNVLGMDHASPEEIYRYGLNHIGIRTDKINLEGLKSLTEREVNYRSPHRVALAADQAESSEDFNPEEILSAYVAKINAT
ncbi:hypothetical protein RF55_17710 [Lasius niger]|uniref:Uncharacterized protein n=1 Tax=Lasius niger TaxID=67767 RepID=A0A0J7K2D7_LASNI|nr:hypothetical protein RF55_17710 [Lasius niger]